MSDAQTERARAHRKVGLWCAGLVVVMTGLAFAAVPLYRLFCQTTGYNGTTQRAEKASAEVLERRVTVRFDANTAPGLPWRFEPVQRTMDVRVGENALAFYRAVNTSDKTITGTAVFNVLPELVGIHFNKIACFCFTEQTLEPGQAVDMPVSFFVDAKLDRDATLAHVDTITLSYTFYPVAGSGAARSADAARAAGKDAGG